MDKKMVGEVETENNNFFIHFVRQGKMDKKMVGDMVSKKI